jgi:hypothetical protein
MEYQNLIDITKIKILKKNQNIRRNVRLPRQFFLVSTEERAAAGI